MENEAIEIRPVKPEEVASLFSFYQDVYPLRADFLKKNWQWLYRTSFLNNSVPYVAVLKNRIIGHFGSIPFVADLNGNKYKAQWFVDFALLPEFRGRKIGPLLSESLVQLTDLCITCCNQHSIKVFKRQGWIQATNAYLHFIFFETF